MKAAQDSGKSDDELLADGSTPGRRDVARLLSLFANDDDKLARRVVRALGRIQSPIVELLLEMDAQVPPRERARRVAAVALRHEQGEAEAAERELARLAQDEQPQVRKAAIRALGSLRLQAGLLCDLAERELAQKDPDPHVQKALIGALGKLGNAEQVVRLTESLGVRAGVAESRSRMLAERVSTSDVGTVSPLVNLPDCIVSFSCRRGLEVTLQQELIALGLGSNARAIEGAVDVSYQGPLDRLLLPRVATHFSLVVRSKAVAADVQSGVAQLIANPSTVELLTSLTAGQVGYRLTLADAKKHRGLLWEVAERVNARTQGRLQNLPHQRNWDIKAFSSRFGVRLELSPVIEDPRFAYRIGDVPAASHPTIAAALARIGGVRPDDVVWDPFVGSGLELCERARLGPYLALLGTDRDERAIARATENLASLGADRAVLREADAREGPGQEFSLLLSNPPMGRRVERGGDLDGLLEAVMHAACDQLSYGGRIVLLSPRPHVTRGVAQARGLSLVQSGNVDLGGFEAELERFDAARRRRV